MKRITLKKGAQMAIGSLILLVIYKASSYKGSEPSVPGPLLQRMHVDSDVIASGMSGHTPPTVLSEEEYDESMKRYDGMSTCKASPLLGNNAMDRLNYPASDPEIWEWIRNRVTQLWDRWKEARTELEKRGELDGFRRKRVLIHPGFLKGTNFARRQSIKAGGPLGELIQWADLIAGLFVLGHNVTLAHNTKLVLTRLLELTEQSPDCKRDYDVIYLDRASISALPVQVIKTYRCRLRVLDVYGTQAMYRDPIYKELHRLHGAPEAEFLQLKQYYTFYPQTPDNTFLGFIVTKRSDEVKTKKENIAVIYGKNLNYIRGKEHYISLLTKYADVHYTMPRPIPRSGSKLYNDGVLSHKEYGVLLDRAKLVIGLGHPIEGTGAMEALAHGSVFFNPKYVGSARNIFKQSGKPTHRLITSQIPYLEQYIGPPYVYTIDTSNDTEVITSIKEALSKTNYEPFVPTEFTMAGYLRRLSLLVERQNFCSRHRNTTWPPLDALLPIEGGPGESCSSACHDKGLVCEPVYFFRVNDVNYLESLNITCIRSVWAADIVHPSVNGSGTGQVCVLQENSRLFSCEGADSILRRICPCRRYERYQVALPG